MQLADRYAGQRREGATGLALAVFAVATLSHCWWVVDTVVDGAAKASACN